MLNFNYATEEKVLLYFPPLSADLLSSSYAIVCINFKLGTKWVVKIFNIVCEWVFAIAIKKLFYSARNAVNKSVAVFISVLVMVYTRPVILGSASIKMLSACTNRMSSFRGYLNNVQGPCG